MAPGVPGRVQRGKEGGRARRAETWLKLVGSVSVLQSYSEELSKVLGAAVSAEPRSPRRSYSSWPKGLAESGEKESLASFAPTSGVMNGILMDGALFTIRVSPINYRRRPGAPVNAAAVNDELSRARAGHPFSSKEPWIRPSPCNPPRPSLRHFAPPLSSGEGRA
ncbi:hypothetical protein KM043_006897 [Ampulex compressa]|nr:hypothetical protein KM043_006897 [Ampulex compressa]